MNTKFKALQIKRQFLIDKHVVGIDPAKARQQAVIVDCHGMLSGKPFTFANSLDGYENLLRKVKLQTADVNAEGIVFAIEAGLRSTSGKPLSTKQSRSMINNDFIQDVSRDGKIYSGSTGKVCKSSASEEMLPQECSGLQ